MRRRRLLVLLLVCLFPALACNLPVAPEPAPTPDVDQAVQQTLSALHLATALPGQTPLPNVQETPFAGLETATPGSLPPQPQPAGEVFSYTTQPGDTVAGLSGRFEVTPEEILDPMKYPPQLFLPVGQPLSIPNHLGQVPFSGALLPDSEIVYSPSAADFDLTGFIQQAGGFLSTYTEPVEEETLTGAQIVQRVANETSINPRMLLAVLEYRSHWVFGSPQNPQQISFPIGFGAGDFSGLAKELTLVARQLSIGYYGWRSGQVTQLEFANHNRQRISPTLNAGTVAVQYLFSKLYDPTAWQAELYNPASFISFYRERFGDPWTRAAAVEPLLPDGLTQPELELPFPPGEPWSFTGGPHAAWGIGSPWGGLDFAPANVERGCGVSRFWATAAASGVVLRSERGMLVVDLDGDGREQTGWVLLYLHIAAQDRVPVGTHLNTGDPIGHPSCEGGVSTGTHEHLSRKYNGEWLAADGPVPFVLSGWTAHAGARLYSGSLTRHDQVVTARPDGPRTSLITR